MHTEVNNRSSLVPEALPMRERVDWLNDQAEYIERTTPAETLRISQNALQMAASIHYPSGVAKSLYLIGRGHLRLGSLFESEAHLKKAYDQVLSLKDPELEAEILNALGIVNLYLKIYDLSFKYFQRALTLSKKIGTRALEARILNNIGEVYRELKDYTKALDFYQQSQETHQAVSSPINKSVAVSNIAGLYLEMNDYDNATLYVDKAIEIAKAEENVMIESACFHYAGIIERKKGHFDASHEKLKKSLELNKITKEMIHEAEVLIDIHRTLFEKGEHSRSLKILFDALKIAQRLNSETLLLQVYDEMIPACEALGKTEDALAYAKKRHNAVQAIEKIERAQRLRGLEIQLEADTSYQEKEAYRALSQALEHKAKELEDRSNELQDAYHTLKVISDIGKQITAVLSLENIFTLVHKHITDLMNADLFGIALYNSETDAIHYEYLVEDGLRVYDVRIPMAKDNSFAVWCYRNRKEIMINSDQSVLPEPVRMFSSSFGALMPAIMFYPLTVEDQIIGIITVQSLTSNVYTKQTLDTLGTLSAYLSIAIQNAQNSERLHLEIQEREAAQQKLRLLNEELAALSEMDGLTGIANRRRFDEFYFQAWSRAKREKEPLTLLMIDIDYFKQYNDTYGHITGDEMIKRTAALISDNVKRTSDLVARYGGDEFIILLSNTDEHGALMVANRIRHALAEEAVIHSRSPLGVTTLSIGMSTCIPDRTMIMSEHIQSVDAALYEAKLAGRNRIVACDMREKRFTEYAS
ncbi:sensor domain-containing diguanylate cyclase [Acidaminobacter hydrogenoformans]|uniref:Diguanylate cyclase (GGDEF) domain-containing protein n=1 Tax=Acidaminobacter hydrogenoformans DSM 2784 TaxID=1120920 RepID=A0A1G5RRV7_9FIRM|nr:diguanylate cyclase [Acidaminobacter hydrogenoformans]SCZ76009.1 diguanylate cyclase (GGDEF) domain-containing protein [Acidaminobacter hydrogenoformans DSM 2784]